MVTEMISIEGALTKETAENIAALYKQHVSIEVTVVSRLIDYVPSYKIQLYHKRYRRVILADTIEEFFEILIMYSELDKINT